MISNRVKRVIFITPKIVDGEEVNEFFKRYNPDSDFVMLHLCLVFPFESDLTKDDIERILNKVSLKRFKIELGGVSVSLEDKNNFLFLNVLEGNSILSEISSILYKELDGQAILKGNYIPHITIGKSKSLDDINKMREEVSIYEDKKYIANVDTIYSKVLKRDENGKIYLEDEIELLLDK